MLKLRVSEPARPVGLVKFRPMLAIAENRSSVMDESELALCHVRLPTITWLLPDVVACEKATSLIVRVLWAVFGSPQWKKTQESPGQVRVLPSALISAPKVPPRGGSPEFSAVWALKVPDEEPATVAACAPVAKPTDRRAAVIVLIIL